MRRGRALPPGGTIGVPAPASPYFNRSELLRGVEWWEAQGYRVKLGAGIHARSMYTAGDARTRADDLVAMFRDDEVDVIHCYQGGYGSAQTIPLIDWEVVRAHPKPFVGYSDITALHLAARHFAGLVTFYGPTLGDIAHPTVKAFNQERLLAALTSTEPLGQVPRNPDDAYLRPIAAGCATGDLVGGCLWLVGQTIGTPWQPDLAGRILFFEDVDVPPWYLDGLLNQMTQAGILRDVAGVVVGELVRCDWSRERPEMPQTHSVEDVLERYLGALGVPVLYGLPMGHGEYLTTTPLGVRVTVDADARTLTVDEPALDA
ncbi:MAG TPA: LD-carboxypeptidase [Euzebyales bacterium]|nr:LD-carboxypeptidase [Euzebyales bacterium]